MPESSESYFVSTKLAKDPKLACQIRLINAVLLLDIFLPQTWRLLHPWLSLRVPVADCSTAALPDNVEVLEFQKLIIEVKTNYLALCSGRTKSDIIWCICHIVLNICSTVRVSVVIFIWLTARQSASLYVNLLRHETLMNGQTSFPPTLS